MKPMRLPVTLLLALLLLLVACGGTDGETAQSEADATAIPPTPTALADVQAAEEAAEQDGAELSADGDNQQLIIWMPPAFAGMVDVEEETAVFQQQLRAFQEENPDIEIIVEEKEVEGSGGMFDYLRTGSPVAPTILPDLIVLPSDRLPVAAGAGLLYPLRSYMPDELVDDLYAAARELADVDDVMLGYPFFVNNLSHMVYDETLFASGLEPRRWRALTAVDEARFVFPAAGTDGAILLLQRYIAEGGRVADDDGSPILEVEPLTNALIAFEDAAVGGTIIPASSSLTTMDEVWPYLSEDGGANVAQMDAARFLAHQPVREAVTFAPFPGPREPLTPLLDSWVWALPDSSDEAERAVAVELLTFLSEPTQLAAWSEESNLLPASQAALAAWAAADSPYIQFVDGELVNAEAMPIADHSAIMIALSEAILNVVSLNQTAVEAAQTAVSAVSP